MSSKYRCHGENWPQRLDLFWTISDLSLDLRVSEVWHFKGTVCTVILRCCKPKSDQKCRSYVTLKHQWILNLQFDHFFRGLKRGVIDKIRCSQWPQGMVLDGLEWFKAKNRKSMTFNYKSAGRYLVLAPVAVLTLFWGSSAWSPKCGRQRSRIQRSGLAWMVQYKSPCSRHCPHTHIYSSCHSCCLK